ncbi:MarR family transcriptional regulator [Bacillus sp. FJAT-42376]|uniref:MarR family winged helix-turn-helix transcriptional regulator n=1 Tax=Bacillus sp. FJAT-42376 TaxID=2014076 RepID=UPI000F500691|nr:MarR family transcriptional regulator [Bacillus sp. FJAT-42376]AZB41519.1 MarR family transcriptional regulator [Bacillus sp. FJAT-42376]
MKKKQISQEEMNIWHMWKGSYQSIFGRVVKDLTDQTGLSEGDFGILDRLDQFGNGELRQQELADSMTWDKSRLSHHLTRMEKRGLVRRKPSDSDRGVQVIITEAGKTALNEARPVVSEAIREHFLSLLTEEDVESIGRIGERVKRGTISFSDNPSS